LAAQGFAFALQGLAAQGLALAAHGLCLALHGLAAQGFAAEEEAGLHWFAEKAAVGAAAAASPPATASRAARFRLRFMMIS
jgi:hypothetical protein